MSEMHCPKNRRRRVQKEHKSARLQHLVLKPINEGHNGRGQHNSFSYERNPQSHQGIHQNSSTCQHCIGEVTPKHRVSRG